MIIRKDRARRVSGIEFEPKPIAPERIEEANAYVLRACAAIRENLPADFDESEVEDQLAAIGNVIYSHLSPRFPEGEILTVRNRILDALRQPSE